MTLTRRWQLGEIAPLLRSGEICAQQMLYDLFSWIDEIEPQVHAFVPGTLKKQSLLQDAENAISGSLFCVPVAVKDIFRVDGYATRAGSNLPAELFAAAEAASVSRLRQAGALILAKSVTTEFAFAEPGPTVNPHNTRHTPGGSSSGSAAACAAGMCLLALGTQTVGSVIRPAAFCGIVGMKPSLDRIPTEGIVYFSRSCDHVGFFTQDVPGARLAASVLCSDWQENLAMPDELPRLGVIRGPYLEQASREACNALGKQLDVLQQAGYCIKQVDALCHIEEINKAHTNLIIAEAAREHAKWFSRYAHLYKPRTREAIGEGLKIGDLQLSESRTSMCELREYFETLMRAHDVDILVSPPACGPAPEGIHSTGNPVMNLPWTHAGVPVVTVPAGRSGNGLPLGIQLATRFGSDELLLGWTEHIVKVLKALM